MKTHKLFLQLIVVSILVIIPQCTSAQKLGNLEISELDAYIVEAMQDWMVPGLSIAIIKNDSIAFSKGYGVRENGGQEPVDENTVFAIASNTKAFTSAALAILDDEAKIDWDDRVRDYLPEFTLYDTFVSNDIRIRDLLCHRSGLKTFSGDLLWYETIYSREDVIYRARYLEPSYGFRYQYGYSNIMYLAAGQIIPAVTGQSWDIFIKKRLLDPLGMNNTYISLKEISDLQNIALPHHIDILDSTSEVLPYMAWDNIAPAGALNSSVSDMSKWLRFQLNMGEWNDSQIVSEENLWETRKMHTIQPVDINSSNVWSTKHFEGYGLGWQLFDYHGCKIIGHGGGSDGMISRIIMVPEEDLGFVILTNSINAIPSTLSYYILDKYFTGKSYDWCGLIYSSSIQGMKAEREEWNDFKLSADTKRKSIRKLNNYCGIYGGELYGQAEIRLEDKHLVLDFLPAPRLLGDLSSYKDDTFLIRLRDIPSLPEGTVKFLFDDSGNISELVVDIPNPDFDFTELKFDKKR
jgi:CubicO group peptidase (beta-lactamase class C family)